MLILKEFVCTEQLEGGGTWSINELRLSRLNLLVGRNATGKTRCLNTIHSLSRYLAGKVPGLGNTTYSAVFEGQEASIEYTLKHHDETIVEEVVKVDGEVLLERGESGKGMIWAKSAQGLIEFQVEPNVVAAFRKRDAIQHEFLEDLLEWASAVRKLDFGKTMGRDRLLLIVTDDEHEVKSDDDPATVAGVFRRGHAKFGNDFTSKIVEGMKCLSYDLEKVELGEPVTLRIQTSLSKVPVNLNVKERDLEGITDFNAMSQGMFRALSLIVHLTYLTLKGASCTLLIDDIGEGLDYERSCALIEYISRSADRDRVQVLMTTNDRFVMNSVALEHWIVLKRQGGQVEAIDYDRAKDKFEQFKLTGLSNFDLLATDFIFQ